MYTFFRVGGLSKHYAKKQPDTSHLCESAYMEYLQQLSSVWKGSKLLGTGDPRNRGISGSLVRGSFGFISVAMTKDDKKAS